MKVRKITTLMFVLVIIALLVGFSACDQIQQLFLPTPPQMEGLSGDIRIGVALPLTGRLASSPGFRLAHGYELAREEINNLLPDNTQITFITEDEQSTVEGAVEAFNKLIYEHGVSVIIGPTTSAQSEVVFPIAQQNQVVTFSPTSNASGLAAIGDFIFRVSLTVDKRAQSIVQITHEKLGYQRVAKIADSVDFASQSSDAAWTASLNASGVEILTTETFQTGDEDFSAQLTRIKALNPDAIFIAALPPDIPDILIQARQLGIPNEVPFIVIQISIDEIQAAGAAAEGLLTASPWDIRTATPENRAFVENYRAKYDIEPNTWAAQAYTTLYILAEAIMNAQSTDSLAIRDALANIMDFDTVLGKFSFNADGDAVYDLVILVVENGELKIFE